MTLSINDYISGNYSPVLLRAEDLPMDSFFLTQEEDNERLEAKRSQVLGKGYIKPDVEDEFEKTARENMGDEIPSTLLNQMKEGDEGESGKPTAKSNTIEVALPTQHYQWSDKYRPRKPRYYNRVHTGYDWNQYNKKHYDVDNPPPKTVQGYKFNVSFILIFN